MAGDSGVLKIALFGGAAFLAYKQGWLSMLGVGTPAVSAPPATPGTPAPNPNAITGANTLDGIFQRLQAASTVRRKSPSRNIGR
jgi:hypothetical protein